METSGSTATWPTTVVPYIDANYPTIPEAAAARSSATREGGYCAASLLFRHPDVFGQAVSLTGYYEAGLESPSTIKRLEALQP